MTLTHVSQTLEDAILDLHRCQLAEQPQSTTQEHRAQSTRVEAEQQRQIKVVQINQIIEEQRNENADALDYEEQQNRDGNGDLYVDRNIQKDILRVISNIFH